VTDSLDSERFLARSEGADPRRARLPMARATGNFKPGG
jgi:hypothetical protein